MCWLSHWCVFIYDSWLYIYIYISIFYLLESAAFDKGVTWINLSDELCKRSETYAKKPWWVILKCQIIGTSSTEPTSWAFDDVGHDFCCGYLLEASPLHPAQKSFGLAPTYNEVQAHKIWLRWSWLYPKIFKLSTFKHVPGNSRYSIHPSTSVQYWTNPSLHFVGSKVATDYTITNGPYRGSRCINNLHIA